MKHLIRRRLQALSPRPRAGATTAGLALLTGTLGTAMGLAALAPLGFAGSAVARQDGAALGAAGTPRRSLEDFLHYVRIARPDLARASATALFESGISDGELAELIDTNDLGTRVESVLRVGRGMDDVGELVAQFESRVEQGRRALSRDPDRIREAVAMLVGTRRQQMLADGRLAEAGEYAVPELLRQVVEGRDPQLVQASMDMLVRIRRQAVTPLCVALPNLDPVNQRRICDVLGLIGWPHAGPYLLALSEDEQAPSDVRVSAARAFEQVGGTVRELGPAWTMLARRYFDEDQSLIAFPLDATNNVWRWDDFVGLVATGVPTPIISEVMAMQTSRAALRAQPDNGEALALFVGANLRRENDLPDGLVDPIFGDEPFSPQFYATAAGISTSTRVLSMALERSDTLLARDAIAALRETAGAGNLALSGAAAPPLVESLQYPDRRVRYDAALTLGNGLPRESFTGDFGVVPTLASAVRSAGATFAIVVAQDAEDRQTLAGRMSDLGFTVLNPAPSVNALEAEIAAAPGVDVIVVRGGDDFVKSEVAIARSNRRLTAVPVLAVTSGIEKIAIDREFELDRRVLAWQAGLGDEQFVAALEQLMTRASGGRIDEAESQQYAIEALQALLGIAESGITVFRVADAQGVLLEALDSRSGGMRLLVAEVLASTPTEEAQRRLLDAALDASESEQIGLLDQVAASARRFGNRVEPRQVTALLELVENSEGDLADAAARVHGALDLPSANAVRLIAR